MKVKTVIMALLLAAGIGARAAETDLVSSGGGGLEQVFDAPPAPAKPWAYMWRSSPNLMAGFGGFMREGAWPS